MCEIAELETTEHAFAIMGTGQNLLDQMGKPHICTCTLPGELAELGRILVFGVKSPQARNVNLRWCTDSPDGRAE